MLILKFIIVQTIIFGVVIFILKKLIFTDTASAVNRLNKTIQQSAKQQEEMEVKMKQCEEECKLKIAKAEEEAEKIKEQARDSLNKEKEEVMGKAKTQSEEIVQKATDAKAKIRKDIEKEMGIRIVENSSKMIKSVFSEKMNTRLNQILAEDFADKLGDMDTSQVDPSVKEVIIITADKLNEEIKKKFAEILKKKLERDVSIKEEIDKDVLGGVMLKFGSLVLDGSLAAGLTESSEALKKEAEG